MDSIENLADWQTIRDSWATSDTIGFVPTMGYLHAGHLSLIRRARSENDHVVASIFVNPLQFGPTEDFASYPRNLSRDLALLQEAGADIVLTPTNAEMYPDGFATQVAVQGPVAEQLEGARRPGHYTGVATIVTKLFHIVRPTRAYFGQKDSQQAAVIKQFVRDLNFNLTISVCPIIREADGLAMSSRNSYLSPAERTASSVLYRALQAARAVYTTGERDASQLLSSMQAVIVKEPLAIIDYMECVHPDTFAPMTHITPPALLTMVVRVGKPRLLDNFLLRTDGTWETGEIAPSISE